MPVDRSAIVTDVSSASDDSNPGVTIRCEGLPGIAARMTGWARGRTAAWGCEAIVASMGRKTAARQAGASSAPGTESASPLRAWGRTNRRWIRPAGAGLARPI